MVIANHPDLADQAPVQGAFIIFVLSRKEIRDEAERCQLDPLRGNVDLGDVGPLHADPDSAFLDDVGCPLINIHHSSCRRSSVPHPLGGPMNAAQTGCATAHYVNANPDEGPIIEQHVVRVDHRHTPPPALRQAGGACLAAARSRMYGWKTHAESVSFGERLQVLASVSHRPRIGLR